MTEFIDDIASSHVSFLLHPTGPFAALNAEQIDSEVSDMWRTMYKLTKTLSDQPGPRTIADRCKIKIDKFKMHLPLLHTICNPGIRDRHWNQVKQNQSDSEILTIYYMCITC